MKWWLSCPSVCPEYILSTWMPFTLSMHQFSNASRYEGTLLWQQCCTAVSCELIAVFTPAFPRDPVGTLVAVSRFGHLHRSFSRAEQVHSNLLILVRPSSQNVWQTAGWTGRVAESRNSKPSSSKFCQAHDELPDDKVCVFIYSVYARGVCKTYESGSFFDKKAAFGLISAECRNRGVFFSVLKAGRLCCPRVSTERVGILRP